VNTLDILLVEDNLMNQKVVKKLLTKYKHHVSIANDGQEAIDK
jgi:CheY-like chemotaxis protein